MSVAEPERSESRGTRSICRTKLTGEQGVVSNAAIPAEWKRRGDVGETEGQAADEAESKHVPPLFFFSFFLTSDEAAQHIRRG